MKKIILSILTAAFILFAGVMALQIVASERVEVVEVKTLDHKGEVATTRLWIIDHEGKQYLRAGADSGWYLRMKADPNITMTRKLENLAFIPLPNGDKFKVLSPKL